MSKRIIVTLLVLMPLAASAQTAEGSGYTEQELLMIGIITMLVFVIFASIGLVYSIFTLTRFLRESKEGVVEVAAEEDKGFWTKFNTKWNDAVPLEREEEVLTDHEYDGIHELDNNLPPWWKAMFYATIVFAVVYLFAVHGAGWIPTQAEAYQAEVADAELAIAAYMATRTNLIDETNVEIATDEVSLTEGTNLFKANCVACHGIDGGGGIGPNLTDEFWIHGGSLVDVFKTIKYGVPQNGMISWEDQMTAEQMKNVASYVMTLKGTTPANPKEPQGELYEEEDAPAVEDSSEEVDSAAVAVIE